MSNILNLKGVRFLAIVLLAVMVLATFGMVAVQRADAALTVAEFSATSSGALTLNSAAASNTILVGASTTGNLTVGSALTTGTITIGGTAGEGAITLGSSSEAQILNLGTGAGASTVNIATGVAANTVNINTGATGANATNIGTGAAVNTTIIGSTNSTSTTTIRAGSGGIVGTGTLTVSGKITAALGVASTAQALTPDDADGAGVNMITAGVNSVAVGANVNGVTDWITLPALADVPVGHTITVVSNAAGHEVRTPAASNEEINSEDADGTTEYAIAAGGQIHRFTKIDNTIGWMGQGFTAIGAVVAAVVPD